MNINNWSGKKKVFAMLGILLIIIGLVVTILLVKTRLESRTRAQKATVLSLTPATQTVSVNGSATLDVNVNPGVNQVNFVKLVINFDPEKFDSSSTTFTVDPTSTLTPIDPPTVTDGQIVVTLTAGSDPTKVVQAPQKLGTLNLKVSPNVSTAGSTQVTFDETATQVRSIGSTDSFNENVLSSATPATINIALICKPNTSTCSWDAVTDASSYHYKVTDVDAGTVVLEGDTPETSIEFPSAPGGTYKCDVAASNSCGNSGDEGSVTDTCPLPSESPTPAPSGSPTPTPSGAPSATPTVTPTRIPSTTPTVTPTLTPTVTPTKVPSATPTLTPTPTSAPSSTPTPTTPGSTVTPTVTATVTPTTLVTPTPTASDSGNMSESVSATPTPSLPPTGSPLVIGGIIGGILILLGGLMLLLL